jgi:peptidoglycan hydrolase-like protein with peptidoglycan-binding domain
LQQTIGNRGVQRLVDAAKAAAKAHPDDAVKAEAGYAVKDEAVKADAVKADAVKGEAPHKKAPPGSPGVAAPPLFSPMMAGDPDLQACRQGARYFRAGSKGGSVAIIQQALIEIGYSLPKYGADSWFGAETHQALVAFQRESELAPDGIVGTLTIGMLDAAVALVGPGPVPPVPAPTPPGPGPEPPGPGPEPPGPEPGPPGPGPQPPGPGPQPPGPEPVVFGAPELQHEWDRYVAAGKQPTQRQQDAFRVLDVGATGPWKQLSWQQVRQSAAQRILRPDIMNQGVLSVCGPATLVHMHADINPVGYARFVHQVFTTATIDGDRANDTLLANSPATLSSSGAELMAEVDWMLFSSMRDTENAIFDYTGTKGEDFAGITMPGEMAEWMEEILGCPKTKHYTSYLWGEVSNAKKVSKLLASHGTGVVVAMLVDADALTRNQKGFGPDKSILNIPDHWIRLMEPIRFEGDRILVTVWTWGQRYTFVYDEDQLEDVLFEFVVGATSTNVSF